MRRFSHEPVRHVLHDDGSLTTEDRQELAGALADPRIISRADADAALDGLLRGYPHCHRYRFDTPRGSVVVRT